MKIKASVTITLVELLELFARSAGAFKRAKKTGLPPVEFMPQTSKQFEGIIVPLNEQDYEESLKLLSVVVKNLEHVPAVAPENRPEGYYWIKACPGMQKTASEWKIAYFVPDEDPDLCYWRLMGTELTLQDFEVAEIILRPIVKTF